MVINGGIRNNIMKLKNIKLEWYVLDWDTNKKKVVERNIFSKMIVENIIREIKAKRICDKSVLREYLKTEFMYCYWNDASCEFFIMGLTRR